MTTADAGRDGTGAARTAIRRATERFAADAGGIAAESWARRPATGGWSPAEITEHVAVANGNVAAALRHLGPLDGPGDVDDELIPYLFYRGDEPPHVAAPSGTWTDPSRALADLHASVGPLLADDRATAELRRLGLPHPVFGVLDGHQWLLFVAAHTLRHHAELLKIAADLDAD